MLNWVRDGEKGGWLSLDCYVLSVPVVSVSEWGRSCGYCRINWMGIWGRNFNGSRARAFKWITSLYIHFPDDSKFFIQTDRGWINILQSSSPEMKRVTERKGMKFRQYVKTKHVLEDILQCPDPQSWSMGGYLTQLHIIHGSILAALLSVSAQLMRLPGWVTKKDGRPVFKPKDRNT